MITRQRGVAIVLAMGVVALAAFAATAIMISQSTWSRQSELAADHVQASAAVKAGVDWARIVLSEDRRTSSVDHLGELWASRLAPLTVENGEIVGHIDDQQGLFNLNNLVQVGKVNMTQLARFRRLLSILGIPVALADSLTDWIDADGELQSANGAEDSYYLAQVPPYLAANQPLVDVEELALVRGFDDKAIALLRPFVAALPAYTPINVNTAPAEVLAATVEGLDLDAARTIVAQREKIYFRSPAEFASRLAPRLKAPVQDIAVSSDFFVVTLRASIGSAQARGAVLLQREDLGWPKVVWRKFI
jgi:general secretion pathway protein K